MAVPSMPVMPPCASASLFSNAVLHGPAGGQVLAGYCLWAECARLVVCDGGGPGEPRLADRGEGAEGGRGLRVVDALAARWGSLRPAGARVVWCDPGQPLRADPSDAWAWLRAVLSASGPLARGCQGAVVMPGALAGAGVRRLRYRAGGCPARGGIGPSRRERGRTLKGSCPVQMGRAVHFEGWGSGFRTLAFGRPYQGLRPQGGWYGSEI